MIRELKDHRTACMYAKACDDDKGAWEGKTCVPQQLSTCRQAVKQLEAMNEMGCK